MAQYEYQIATSAESTGGLVNLETISSKGAGYYDMNPPFDGRVELYPYVYKDQDGYTEADGYPTCRWAFGHITKNQIATLRQYCSGKSAQVYIRTRLQNDEGWGNYLAIMHWPQQSRFRREASPDGFHENFVIEFTHMELQ